MTTNFQDTGLATATTYGYRVSASNAWGASAYSNVATATTLPNPPGAPTAFTAVAVSATRVNLSWQPGDMTATGYTIQRSTTGNTTDDSAWQTVLSPGGGATTASDATCQPATTYYYRICANNAGGSSASAYANADGNGNPGPVTTLAPPVPAAPSGLTATGVSSSEIDLSWTDNSVGAPNGGQATGFQIQRHIGPAGTGTYAPIASVAALPTTYADTGLTPNTTYTYRVRATNAGGYSAYSNEATATTAPAASAGAYLASLTLNPPGISANGQSTGTVTLNHPDVTDTTVVLSASIVGDVSVPSQIVIPASHVSASFQVRGTQAAIQTGDYVTIRGSANGWTQGNILTATPSNAPVTVQNLVAAGGNGCVVLAWNDMIEVPINAIKGFHVYRSSYGSTGPSTELTSSGPIFTTTFADTDPALSGSVTYYYEVAVEYWDGTLASSGWVPVTTNSSVQQATWVDAPSGSVSGIINLNASLPSQVLSSTCILLVDGHEFGGSFSDDQSPSGTNEFQFDTSDLIDGVHTIQVVDSGDTIGATPKITITTANDISGTQLPPFFVPASGDLGLIYGRNTGSSTNTWDAQVTSDDSGAVVFSKTGQGGSDFTVAWDGTDSSGAAVAPGDYTLTLSATDGQGQTKTRTKKIKPTQSGCAAILLVAKIDELVSNANAQGTVYPAVNADEEVATAVANALYARYSPALPVQKLIASYNAGPLPANLNSLNTLRHWIRFDATIFYASTHDIEQAGDSALSNNPNFQWNGIGFLLTFPVIMISEQEYIRITGEFISMI